ncbi:MAG: hypothetical protein GTO63_20005 [Anaerolineae bacterium]|nr:hypothetical protein [Anaerolineae bacterium]NIN97064.1 hypothetical protein [Anaerolineae bacterium]NIQ80013.1 hypothetical protein [Anaerolineae bacterium]
MSRHDELTIVDRFVERVPEYHREVAVNYYVALKTKRFVIVAGPRNLNKMGLARGLAAVLVGEPGSQWSLFQAHPWWATRTGAPGQFAVAHARFTNLKLLDVIEAASASEAAGLPLPFFVGIERMSPAEAVCYFDDLPEDRLWQPGGAVVQIRVPHNLYVTGSLDLDGKGGLVQSQGLHRHAILIRLHSDDAAPLVEPGTQSEPGPDWQPGFVRSRIHRGDQARAKLAGILPDHCAPLAPLDELLRRIGVENFPASVYEEAWLYVANAFDGDGRGLFVEPALENLAIAQDYAILQSVLPAVITGWLESPTRLINEVGQYLSPCFPRAYASIEQLSRQGLADGPLRG